jgi:hypothetical protein
MFFSGMFFKGDGGGQSSSVSATVSSTFPQLIRSDARLFNASRDELTQVGEANAMEARLQAGAHATPRFLLLLPLISPPQPSSTVTCHSTCSALDGAFGG